MTERQEQRGGKPVTVVERPRTPEELAEQDRESRIKALEDAMRQVRPGWQPPPPPAGYTRK